MSPGDARDAARRAFGGQVEQVKERQRDARSFRWLDESWLDLKLGARMLIKYPGLTLIAVVALSVAIGGGAAYLEFVNDLFRPTLPGKGRRSHRRHHELERRDRQARASLTSRLRIWRDAAAFGRRSGRVRRARAQSDHRRWANRAGQAAWKSAPSAFRLMPVAPLLGRPLVPDDERAGAPTSLVLGYPLWQSRFGGDPGVVGRACAWAAPRTPSSV